MTRDDLEGLPSMEELKEAMVAEKVAEIKAKQERERAKQAR